MRKTVNPRDWIASQRVTAVDPGGRRRAIAIRIGKPHRVTKGGWACPADSGVSGRHAARGSDSFQVLCLAISLVRALIEDFVERGGRFLDPIDDSEWPPDEMAAIFGSVRSSLGRCRSEVTRRKSTRLALLLENEGPDERDDLVILKAAFNDPIASVPVGFTCRTPHPHGQVAVPSDDEQDTIATRLDDHPPPRRRVPVDPQPPQARPRSRPTWSSDRTVAARPTSI